MSSLEKSILTMFTYPDTLNYEFQKLLKNPFIVTEVAENFSKHYPEIGFAHLIYKERKTILSLLWVFGEVTSSTSRRRFLKKNTHKLSMVV